MDDYVDMHTIDLTQARWPMRSILAKACRDFWLLEPKLKVTVMGVYDILVVVQIVLCIDGRISDEMQEIHTGFQFGRPTSVSGCDYGIKYALRNKL